MNKYIASKDFYKEVSAIAIPLAIQSVFTSCLGIVDTLMVSWIGMVSAVGTAAQIDSIANCVAFGAISGTGIFCAQFFGAKDGKKLKQSFGISLVLATLIGLFFFAISAIFGESILKFYVDDPQVIKYGGMYLDIVKYSFLPSILSFAFSYVYRSIHKTKVPLIISIVSMATNCILNYILIFGLWGFPELGVEGAAYATVFAQFLSLALHIGYALKTKQQFMGKFSELFSFDLHFIGSVMSRVSPLIMNELLFGFGSTMFVKAFGALGTDAMDAYFVGTKISDVFFFVIMGLSNANTVITGHTLGSGDLEKAKQQGNYFIGIGAALAIIMSIVIVIFAEPMVSLFKLQDPAVFESAVTIVRVFSIKISLRLFIVIVFGALRAGGDSKILTLLDSGLMWAVGIPLAFFAVHVLKIESISFVFLIIQLEQVIRMILGLIRYKSYKWAVNLTRI
ncbi:MAG: MATE family efflux transporter [Oscillospiraceae bacterium]